MKAELGSKIIIEFVRLRAKTSSYLKDHGGEDKKNKGTKKCVTKKKFNLKMIKTIQNRLNLRIK